MKKKLAILAPFVLLLSLVISPIAATPASADVIGAEECFPAVLMLKGSGEGEENGVPVGPVEYAPDGVTEPYIYTNGHEGGTIRKLLKEFVNYTDPAKTVSKTRFIGLETPSLPVFPNFVDVDATNFTSSIAIQTAIAASHIISYNESYRAGAQNVVDFIRADQARGCETQYMLVSYSQGVISARLAMNLLNNETDKVISSYAIGDPFQKANGVSSSRQFTAANTSPHTVGVGSMAAATLSTSLSTFPVSDAIFGDAINSINGYYREMAQSNSFIYRDDGPSGPVSRALCHVGDLVCGWAGNFNMEGHLNYFDDVSAAGSVDVSLEIAEFDKQVQTLANSTTLNPRQRVLTKTPSIIGGITSYNVANARPDDLCTWDEDSDGSHEVVNAPCEILNVKHQSEEPKMTVTVTDTFGIKHTLGSTASSIDQKAVDLLTGLEPDSWYQFKLYNESSYCVDRHQPYYDSFRRWEMMGYGSCVEPPNLYSATQVYKAEAIENSDEIQLLWGYDDDLALTSEGSGIFALNFDTVSSSLDAQRFGVRLLFVENNVPYYVIRQGDLCMTSDEWGYTSMETCDHDDSKQWFSASKSEGEFGAVSVEKDTTPPTDVKDLIAVVGPESIKLEWSHATDGRTDYVDYIVTREDVSPKEVYVIARTEEELRDDDKTPGDNFFNLGEIQPKAGKYKYSVRARDYAGNQSLNSAIISFSNPGFFSTPEDPELMEFYNGPDKIEAEINFPSIPVGMTAEIERNGERYLALNSSSFTEVYTERGAGYSYRYRIPFGENVYSEWSESLEVYVPEYSDW